MKKTILWILVVVLSISMLSMFSLAGCKEDVAEEAVEESVEESTEEAAPEEETAEVEEVAEAEEETLPSLNDLIEMAFAGKYDKPYLEDISLIYGDIIGGVPYTDAATEGTKNQFILAGGKEENWMYLDNQYDSDVALKNIDIIVVENPDACIWFQGDNKLNALWKEKMDEAGIKYLVSTESDVPGVPAYAIDNFQASYDAGEWAIDNILEPMGGIEELDLIVLGQNPRGGELALQRSEGFGQAFADRYGFPIDDPIIIREDFGAGLAEDAKEAMSNILAANPDAEVIALTTINENTMEGAVSALEAAGKWDPDKIINMGYGCDPVGQQQLRDGSVDGYIGFFPENYGHAAIPMLIGVILGIEVPHTYYMKLEIITPDNIDDYYPAE